MVLKKTNDQINKIGRKPYGYTIFQQIEDIKQNDFKLDPLKNLYQITRVQMKQFGLVIKTLIQIFNTITPIVKDYQNLRNKLAKWESKKIMPEQSLKDYVELKQKQIKENNQVQALAFTHNCSQIIAGSNNNIQIWSFSDGELKKDKLLKGHSTQINALVVSKKIKWLASGNLDGSILTWKCSENNEWQSKKPEFKKDVSQKDTSQQKEKQIFEKHTSFITCLILNRNEDELISSSMEEHIIIWKVNCYENKCEHSYEIYAKLPVNWMSLSKSEDKLITFHYKARLILWSKQDNKWSYNTNLRIGDFCNRGCFIGENEFVMQQYKTDKIQVFSVMNNKFQSIQKNQLQLQCECTTSQFPSMLNKRRQVLLHKCGKLIYIIKVKPEGKLHTKICIDCGDQNCFGVLSKNGDYLIVWSQNINYFRIYKINYEK